jgi:hypothetical protein
MFSLSAGRSTTGSIKLNLTLFLAVLCVAILFAWLSRTAPDAPLPAASSSSSPEAVYSETDDHDHGQDPPSIEPQQPLAGAPSTQAPESDLEDVKAQQAKAARFAIEAKPVSGPLSGRPQFVSEMEWGVLLDATGGHPEMDEQLTHLVNKLLFFKKRKAWMAPTMDATRRKRIANELLAMIPSQVSGRAIDPAFADKLEHDLQRYLDSVTEDDR